MQSLRQRARPEENEEEETKSSAMTAVVKQLKKLDVYPKIDDDYESNAAVKTSAGALVSIISGVIIFVLFMSELVAYLSVTTTEHIVVDTGTGHKLKINFDITFPALKCSEARIDVMDVSGEQQLSVAADIYHQRLDPKGNKIGVAFQENYDGVEEESHADHNGEGCTVYGFLQVNKVAGNFHIALGASHSRNQQKHVHSFRIQEAAAYNSSHIISHLSFGEKYPGMKNPLDGTQRIVFKDQGTAHFQYFVKVVPTSFVDLKGRPLLTNQFSVTEQAHHIKTFDSYSATTQSIPGVFFIYDLSPFMVKVTESKTAFSQFITSVCAIVGGVFTIAGVVDSVIYHGNRLMKISINTGGSHGRHD